MSTQTWTYLLVGLTFLVYIIIETRDQARLQNELTTINALRTLGTRPPRQTSNESRIARFPDREHHRVGDITRRFTQAFAYTPAVS